MGVRLFRRTGHGVVLTEAGEAFATDAKRLLSDARNAVEKAQSAGRGEIGQLNIGFTGSAAFNPVVSKLIREFRQSFPNVNLSLVEGNTAQLLAYLHDKRLDVAFVRLLAEEGVLTVPGSGFGMPGHIRISLTVERDTVVRGLPGFERAFKKARG